MCPMLFTLNKNNNLIENGLEYQLFIENTLFFIVLRK